MQIDAEEGGRRQQGGGGPTGGQTGGKCIRLGRRGDEVIVSEHSPSQGLWYLW